MPCSDKWSDSDQFDFGPSRNQFAPPTAAAYPYGSASVNLASETSSAFAGYRRTPEPYTLGVESLQPTTGTSEGMTKISTRRFF